MTRAELATLPKGTKLFLISRTVSRSGMRQVFDVFYLPVDADPFIYGKGDAESTYRGRPSWIRISGQGQREFNKRFGVHACGSVDEDRRVGGSFYVNGCGFSRSDALAESLSIWASEDPRHFSCEVL